MNTIEITIKGPGQTINYEMEIIQRALENAGISVHVINEHPYENMDEFNKIINERILKGEINKKAKLIAKHQPWGG